MSQKPEIATTTAGLRGTTWNPDLLPPDVKVSVHALPTQDGAQITGYLFTRGGERSVVCAMHPRELSVAQYLVPEVLAGGAAMWVQGARSPGNDLRLEHETALLDLAAGQIFLRGPAGFEITILQGTSGGGPLAAFYCQQSALPGRDRIARTPGGRPSGLTSADLPPPDGVIFVSTHLGQGRLLMNCIDPAVTDEDDPLLSDESISAFNVENGFRRPPESATYSPDFLKRYRAAQLARVARIDQRARELLARKAEARKRAKEQPSRQDAILAAWSPIFTVWRTDADPRCFDLALDPSERAYGTLWGANPVASNYGSIGFARVCTPESWLSNWSGLSSNASMEACAPDIAQPVLMIQYTGDNSVFPAEADLIFKWIGSSRKERHRIHGNHHGQPVRRDAANGQRVAGEVIRAWLATNRLC